MARSFNGSSEYLLATDTPVSAYPLTICAWVYAANQSHNGSALVISDASVLDSSIGIRTNSGTAGAYDYTPASGFLESTGGTVTASTWVHLAGVFASATSRTVYVNGSAGTPNTSNSGRSFGNEDTVTVGRLTRSSPTGYFNGRIAEAAIWTVALTQPELAALASGTSPLLIQPQALVRYYPILGVSPETNYKAGVNLTLTGSTVADHVRIARPVSPIIYVPLGGDVTAPTLTSPTGTNTGATTASGTVDTDEGNGTLYWIVDQSATPPSVAQIQAGNDSGGAAADASGNQAVTGTGTQNVSATGLVDATTYYFHYQHQDAAANDSTVVSSTSFTTGATFQPAWARGSNVILGAWH